MARTRNEEVGKKASRTTVSKRHNIYQEDRRRSSTNTGERCIHLHIYEKEVQAAKEDSPALSSSVLNGTTLPPIPQYEQPWKYIKETHHFDKLPFEDIPRALIFHLVRDVE
jgi:hypothetical protein